MSFVCGNIRRPAHFFENVKPRLLPVLLVGFLIVHGAVIANESEKTSCLRLRDNAERYNACLQEAYDDVNKYVSNAEQQNSKEKPCYCDIRKQKQVEMRMIKISSGQFTQKRGADE